MNQRWLICAFYVGLLLAAPGTPRRPVKKAPPPPPPDAVLVTPSEAIELRVALEVAKAEEIMAHLSPANAFASGFLVSAIYYHNGFLDGYPAERQDLDPTSRIDALILQAMPPGFKRRYFDLLRSMSMPTGTPLKTLLRPVAYEPPPPPGRGRRVVEIAHDDALDMFVDEGTPIASATDGLVVESETGWKAEDPFSTSAIRGGNEVIVFDPVGNRFFRYCHLETVLVVTGQMVDQGDFLGTVGHTGFNAVMPGHGQHLHFEINRVDGGATRTVSRTEIQEVLRSAGDPR